MIETNFIFKTIKRSEITLADYNPRKINAEEKKRLELGLKKRGLVEPLVWNQRTGNLVGGHQRISIMDDENDGDYDVPVAVIDVDKKEEIETNVFLNNQQTQGVYDDFELAKLIKTAEIDAIDLGFDQDTILALNDLSKDIDVELLNFDTDLENLEIEDKEKISKEKKAFDESHDGRIMDEAKKKYTEELQHSEYNKEKLVIYFTNDVDKNKFCNRFGIDVKSGSWLFQGEV